VSPEERKKRAEEKRRKEDAIEKVLDPSLDGSDPGPPPVLTP
jgi:hypothetical protein